MYNEERKTHGIDTYKRVSSLLRDAKQKHVEDFLKSDRARKTIKEGKTPDPEQSWRAFKGKSLEKLLKHITEDCIGDLGLRIINGNTLEKTGEGLSRDQNRVKRNLLVDYGEYGCHLPDADLVIYEPTSCKIIAILSSKVTLRERIAQTGYWKLKLSKNNITEHIRVLFVTLDEDSTLTARIPAKKGRAIAESDTDGTYVLTTDALEESSNIKLFDKFIDDIRNYRDSLCT